MTLTEIKFLINVCKTLKWNEGVLCILRSAFAKNLFVLATLEDKIEIVERILDKEFVSAFVDMSHGEEYLQSSGFIK